MTKTRVEEKVGTFSHVKNRFQSGMVIAALEDGSTVKGVLEDGEELIDGMSYRFMGRTDNHPKYGRQFFFSSFVVETPHTRRAVVKYLTTYAEGVGVVKANDLFDTFGPGAVKVLADEPARVIEAKILSPERAAEASETLRGMEATRATQIDLMGLLDGKGFPKKIVSALIKRFGASAARDVREDPYLLLRHFKGAGFLRTDKLYIDLHHDPASLPRQMYCIWHHLRSSTTGHTWHSIDTAVQALRDSVSGAKLRPTKAIELGIKEDRLAVWKDAITKDGWVAEAAKASNERTVAEEIKRLLGVTGSLWPSHHALSDRLTPHQREQLGLAMRLPVAILIGTPGTGKTFCAAAVAAALCRSLGASNVAACAPTGKAAVRLTQKFREYEVPL
jgi:exodeoxyribonuclease V alpha subunit